MAGLWRYDLDDLTETACGLSRLPTSYEHATSSRESAGSARTALDACLETCREADAAGVRGLQAGGTP